MYAATLARVEKLSGYPNFRNTDILPPNFSKEKKPIKRRPSYFISKTPEQDAADTERARRMKESVRKIRLLVQSSISNMVKAK